MKFIYNILPSLVKFVAISVVFMSINNKELIYIAGIIIIIYISIHNLLGSLIVGQGKEFILLHNIVGTKDESSTKELTDLIKDNDIGYIIRSVLDVLLFIGVIVRILLLA